MQAEELAYAEAMDGRFGFLAPVRVLGAWRVLAGGRLGAWLLLLVPDDCGAVTVCAYDDEAEWRADIALLERLPPDKGAGAGAGVPRRPAPPRLSAGNARPWPPGDDEEGRAA